jgi:hypothetical protein
MTSFTLTPVEKGILRCHHTGPLTPEDVHTLAAFFYDYGGKLLVDLSEATGDECSRHIHQFRPMMPTAAIFGADIDPAILDIPDSYYIRDVRYFDTEEEALTWLRNQ